MTSHYDTSRSVKFRCDGDHEFSEPYLDYSDMSIVLEDGEVYIKIQWSIMQTCTNDHTNDVPSTTNKCQWAKTVERDSKLVPVSELEEK